MADPKQFHIPNKDDVDYSVDIVLQSNDDAYFKLSRKAAEMSQLLTDMIKSEEEGNQIVIPTPNIDGHTLGWIVAWMEHHKDARPDPIEKPLRVDIQEVLSEFNKKFICEQLVEDGDYNKNQKLQDVIMGANFLGVRDLLEMGCAMIAHMIKGKTAEEIRQMYGIEKDFTEEEEKRELPGRP